MLEIGDKIKWNNIRMPHDTIYTVKDIDKTRPIRILARTFFLKEEILIEWEQDGKTKSTWAYDYDEINKNIEKGSITIVQKHNIGTPIRSMKKLNLTS